MLPVEDALTIEAPPYTMLVERADLQRQYPGIIQLSESYKKYAVGAVAEVMSVGLFCGEDYRPGDKVLLAPQAGKKLEFGWNADITYWRISPSQVICKLIEGEAAIEGASPFRSFKERDFDAHQTDPGRDEGDPQGLR